MDPPNAGLDRQSGAAVLDRPNARRLPSEYLSHRPMTPEFTTGQIRPIECVKEGWALIKDDYWVLFGVSIVGGLIAGVSMYALLGPMVCGIFICYLKKLDGGRVIFDDLWLGFKY